MPNLAHTPAQSVTEPLPRFLSFRNSHRMAAEKFQGIILLPAAGRDIEHKISVRVLIGRELPPIHSQKHVRGSSSDPLVPVDERMTGNEMKKIRSGHALQIFVQKMTAKSRLRHVDGGLKKTLVANAWRSAESTDLLFVNGDHFSQREKRDFHGLTPQVCEAFSHTA